MTSPDDQTPEYVTCPECGGGEIRGICALHGSPHRTGWPKGMVPAALRDRHNAPRLVCYRCVHTARWWWSLPEHAPTTGPIERHPWSDRA